ncbi:hypothetical protein TWF730_000821 [Orbilia blumenaviensis]|uniref:Uncharacterized protein n=1 Tax=Orbilia blumenaviensis TaxID=1796055 RepID=A0AAV9VTY4_9PEZI
MLERRRLKEEEQEEEEDIGRCSTLLAYLLYIYYYISTSTLPTSGYLANHSSSSPGVTTPTVELILKLVSERERTN